MAVYARQAFGQAVAADELVQGMGIVGQIDRVSHLCGGEGQQFVRRIGRLQHGVRGGGVKAALPGDAQAAPAEHKDEILPGIGTEAEGQQHAVAVEGGHEARARAAAHVAVQAGQHVFHAGHGIAVTGQIITG